MYDPYDDEDFPRVIRSAGVAPLWRILAILGMIGILGIGSIAVVLAIALVDQQNASAPPAFAPPVGIAGNAGVNNPLLAAGEGDDDADEPGPHPYPTQQDVNPDTIPIPGEPAPAKDPRGTPQERFVGQATEIWKGNQNDFSVHLLSVSPTGQTMAYADSVGLLVGSIARPAVLRYVDEDDDIPAMGGAAGGFRAGRNVPGRMGAAGLAQQAKRRLQAVGTPTCSKNGRFLFFAASDGTIREYDTNSQELRVLPLRGTAPAPIPTDEQQLVFVQSKPMPKIELPGSPMPIDPTLIVLGNKDGTRQPTVLVPASQSTWLELAVSPDGEHLALVSDRGHEKDRFAPQDRVFLMDFPGGEPKPISPSAWQISGLSWLADGKGLVYSRSHATPPPDHWEGESRWVHGQTDLFLYDLQTQREIRLSRAGGFQCAGTGAENLVYFRADENGAGGHFPRLMLLDMKAALKFVAAEPEQVIRDAKSWSDLIDQVFRDATVDAEAEKGTLTPDLMARVAESYTGVYEQRFKTKPPACLKDLERQRWEVRSLDLSPTHQKKLRLLLGAVEGEYLRQKHAAVWHLAANAPARKQENFAEPRPESSFAAVFDVIHPASMGYVPNEDNEDESDGVRLSSRVRAAAGRPLILTNDSETGKAAAEELADPDLEKGRDLLAQGKNADALLKALVKKHPDNYFLALHVSKLLLENRRREAVQQILQPLWEPSVLDAQKHNLLGVAYLEDDPSIAEREFYVAYGHDLSFSPALLNLAQAYQANRRTADAEKCLRHFLRRFPGDAHVADARQRLAALQPQP